MAAVQLTFDQLKGVAPPARGGYRRTDGFGLAAAPSAPIPRISRSRRGESRCDFGLRGNNAKKEEAPTGGRGLFGFLWGNHDGGGKPHQIPIHSTPLPRTDY